LHELTEAVACVYGTDLNYGAWRPRSRAKRTWGRPSPRFARKNRPIQRLEAALLCVVAVCIRRPSDSAIHLLHTAARVRPRATLAELRATGPAMSENGLAVGRT
jgi:hypothetical protein